MTLPALKINELPEEFFIDVAVGVDPFEDICDNYELSPEAAAQLEADPAFQRRLRIAKQVVEDDGRAFRSRCRVAVTNAVHHVVHMLRDTDVPASVQLDAFKTLVKFGDLEPAAKKDQSGGGPALTLNIVAPDGTSHNFTAQVEPEPIEAEYSETPREDCSRDVPELSIVPPAGASLFDAQ